MTKDDLLAALAVERFGPRPLPPAAPPHPVDRALAGRAAEPPPAGRRRKHLLVIDGSRLHARTNGDTMEIVLEVEQVELLAAVQRGQVHMDPRIRRPDYERLSDNRHHTRRATARLRPLKKAELVELAEAADHDGVRLYRLTDRGEAVLAAAQQQAEDAKASDTSTPGAA
ncbi:hypothetical protein E1091_10255 [Micromonospora fluostatini]|uniref:Uncharacterized protein n=1 Tax=Micromonospora fluostatini TaxID=1629071 RepID=A0ABY2DHM4_9ACTN|nr:hypothetical protein E1091_10255 [Micromonospora fluostatini]